MSSEGQARRDVLKAGMAMAAAASARAVMAADIGRSALTQPPLPWAETALEPIISARTLEFHYGKHHATYFKTLDGLIKGTPLADKSLEEIILATAGEPGKRAIFNNAAQCWNHNFYWTSLTPDQTAPEGKLLAAITRDFGSVEALKAELAKVTIGQFGSGWGWLVSDNGTLKVVSTSAADVPFTSGLKPLLTIDVWEHAYYLDWQNRRADHVNALVKDHLDWRFAAKNFG